MHFSFFSRPRNYFLPIFISLTLGISHADPVTVTVTQASPIETLAADGSVTGLTRAVTGAHYTFVSSDGSKVILQDATNVHYRIALASTDYTPPAAASPTPAPSAPAPVPAPAAPATAAVPAPPPPPVTPAPSPTISNTGLSTDSSPPVAPATSDAVTSINKGLGKDFFSTQNLWKESALLAANRLGLRLEGKTKWETSYRRYFYDREGRTYDPAAILGGKAYCVALYADANDNPTSLLVAFTNDGDYEGVARLQSEIFLLKQKDKDKTSSDDQKKIDDLQAQVDAMKNSFENDRKNEATTLTQNLTTLFGDPERTSFGSNVTTRENALRWNWNGASFLLTCEENKYNLLRIIPTDLADSHGRTERIPHDDMVAKLADAVEHRPDGDVVITQIPMADQGLKGYCVPATWERVLRYTGVPGDMYTLSRVGGSNFGGGTSVGNVASELDATLHDYGRRAEFINITIIDTLSLHRYIDKGIPVFWCLNPAGYDSVEERYALVDRDKDWDAWKKLLDQSRANTKKTPLSFDGGHQVLIIGYNPDTKEIAWSDPWGRNTQERWMTQEEAQRCSLGTFYIITL